MKTTKTFLVLLALSFLLSSCGYIDVDFKAVTISDETMYEVYHVNMAVFDIRMINRMYKNNKNVGLSINSRNSFNGNFFYFEITSRNKPYEFSGRIQKVNLVLNTSIDEMNFDVYLQFTAEGYTSSGKPVDDIGTYLIYVKGKYKNLNYFLFNAVYSKSGFYSKTYRRNEPLTEEDTLRIENFLRGIFSKDNDNSKLNLTP